MSIKDFSFLTITYNHSAFIIEHLESIKDIVLKYGKNIPVDLIIADDCSKDDTVFKVTEWTTKNSELFNNIDIIERKENVGTVKNLADAITKVKTDDFKMLAGDDKYNLFDIFELYQHIGDKVIISPVETFGNKNMERELLININQQVLFNRYKKGRMIQLMKIDNFIISTGLFIPGKYLKNKDLWNNILDFKLIEDYPMIMFLIEELCVEFVIIREKHIKYRLDAGVSNDSRNSARSIYMADMDKMHRKYKMKAFIIPKAINPYRYWLKLQRYIALRQIKKNRLFM